MKTLRSLLYWRSHGFTWPRAWNLTRHPLAKPIPAWRVYTAVIGAPVAVVAVVLFVIRAVRNF